MLAGVFWRGKTGKWADFSAKNKVTAENATDVRSYSKPFTNGGAASAGTGQRLTSRARLARSLNTLTAVHHSQLQQWRSALSLRTRM